MTITITIIGGLFVIVAAWSFRSRSSLPWLLSAAVALPASAAVTGEGESLVPFYLLSLLAVLAAADRWLGQHHTVERKRPGRPALLWFLVVSLTMTAVAPFLFKGVSVLSSRTGLDAQVIAPDALGYTASNVAQGMYLVLSISVVFFLANQRNLTHALPAVGLALGTGLSALRWLMEQFGLPWPRQLFDTASVAYTSGTYQDVQRLRGVFAEPSELAAFSLAAAAFFLSAAWRSQGARRWGNLAVAAVALLDLSLSQAGTAVAAAGAVSALAAGILIWRCWRGRVRIKPRIVALAVAVVAAVGHLWGAQFLRYVDDLIAAKMVSSSFESRTASLEVSWEVFWNTWGLGAGLGSNRPSSMALLLLSCTGIIGTALLSIAVWSILRRAWRVPTARPAAWALMSLLIAKVIATPDLSTPLLWLLIGVCAHAAWEATPSSSTEAERARGASAAPARA